MRRLVGCLAAVAVGLGCAGLPTPPGVQATPPLPDDAVVMRQHTFTDPGSGGMASHTVLAPSGWEAKGQAVWAPPAMFNVLPSQDITVTAPDGRRVRIGPTLAAGAFEPARHLGVRSSPEGAVEGGYPVMYLPPDLDAWAAKVEAAVRSNEPGASDVRVAEVVPIPDLTAGFQPLLQQLRGMQISSPGMRQSVDAVFLGASVSWDQGGQAWEGRYLFGVLWSVLESQVGRQVYWSIEPNLSFRAPAGQLEADLPLLMAVAYSARPTPDWARAIAEHNAKMQGISAAGHRDRMAILSETNRQIAKQGDDRFAERMASMDETQRVFVNSIREVDDFVGTGAAGTPVKLPSHYDQVYTNGQGDYLLTNSPTWNPNTDGALNAVPWESMQRVE